MRYAKLMWSFQGEPYRTAVPYCHGYAVGVGRFSLDPFEGVCRRLAETIARRIFFEYIYLPDISLAVYEKFKEDYTFHVGALGNGRVDRRTDYLGFGEFR